MIITTSGFVRYLDLSKIFCGFTSYHHTFGKYIEVYNAEAVGQHDFELVKLDKRNNFNVTIHDPMPAAHETDIMNVLTWLFNNCTNGTLTMNVDAVNALLAERFNIPNSLDVYVNEMFSDDNKGIILPNVLHLRYGLGEEITKYEFHLNSVTFEEAYKLHDIEVICPTENVDDLLYSKEAVLDLINKRGMGAYADALNKASKEHPYSATTGFDVLWVNKDTPTDRLNIRFNFIVYGNAADDRVALNLAIREYVTANTAVPISIWETVLPEIFTATTFLAIPDWDKISIGEGNNAIYNPISNHSRIVEFFKNHITGYNGDFVDNHYQTLPTLWQSLSMGVCGSPSNREGFYSLSASLDDYALIGVDSPDFIYVSPPTQDFMLKLNNLLPAIQSYKGGDSIPDGLELEMIDQYRFLVFTSYNIKFKILTKEDFLAIFREE